MSSRGQVDRDGFRRQELAIQEYAGKNQISISRIFREKGVSGVTDLENRPALLDLFECLAANGTKTVLVERLDRLARDLLIQETIIGDFRKKGFTLISVAEPDLLSADPTRILMRQIFGAIAQYEKAMIVAKLRGARERVKQRHGRCEGRKPFGFYSGEPEVLDKMRELRATGLSFDRIADWLNSAEVAPRLGNRWWGKTVNNILTEGQRHDRLHIVRAEREFDEL